MDLAPRVSVIVISQAQKAALVSTLGALGAPPPVEEGAAALFEVIVVDCGSQDGSGQVDEEFPYVTVLRLPRNFGWARAFNIGSRTAKGEYLLHVPVGLRLAAEALPKLLGAIEGQAQVGAVAAAGQGYALPKPGDKELRAVEAGEVEYPYMLPVLFPRVALASMNFFPDSYGQYYADLELFHKMKVAGKRVVVLPDVEAGGEIAPTPLIDEETAEADRLQGLGAYYSKNYGFAKGLGFWLGQTLGAALRFRLGLAGKLLSSTKVDGL
jgi:glycosyltransferase involved in cell wall biosynthesis